MEFLVNNLSVNHARSGVPRSILAARGWFPVGASADDSLVVAGRDGIRATVATKAKPRRSRVDESRCRRRGHGSKGAEATPRGLEHELRAVGRSIRGLVRHAVVRELLGTPDPVAIDSSNVDLYIVAVPGPEEQPLAIRGPLGLVHLLRGVNNRVREPSRCAMINWDCGSPSRARRNTSLLP
jgi:hypothetical protein